MRAHVLIVEDDKAISELISLYLRKDGLSMDVVDTAEAALDVFGRAEFDLVILDINLPGMDGFEFLQKFRIISTIPIIIVSARAADEDKLLGLGMGADDFITKPFSPRELAARVRSQLRRVGYDSAGKKIDEIGFGPFSIIRSERRLEREGKTIPLRPKEFDLLMFLASHPRVPFRPEDLYQNVWGPNFGDISTVGGHIRRLRKKIESNPSAPCWIQTVHGFGYRFDPDGGTQCG
jgi:two-component system response regulator RegX3